MYNNLKLVIQETFFIIVLNRVFLQQKQSQHCIVPQHWYAPPCYMTSSVFDFYWVPYLGGCQVEHMYLENRRIYQCNFITICLDINESCGIYINPLSPGAWFDRRFISADLFRVKGVHPFWNRKCSCLDLFIYFYKYMGYIQLIQVQIFCFKYLHYTYTSHNEKQCHGSKAYSNAISLIQMSNMYL